MCCAPNIPRTIKLHIKILYTNLDIGLKALPRITLLSSIGNSNNISIAPNIATTPNSLLGIERNIA